MTTGGAIESRPTGHGAAAERADVDVRLTRTLAWLIGAVVGFTILHIWLVSTVHGPWVFSDELGYERLAQSVGQSGTLSLFGKSGLSYAPLYSVVLAPLYAFHLSGQEAYQWAKIVNCVLMSLATIPIYRIGRYVLSPGRAALAAGLSLAAPLMLYSGLEMSENLDYPLFLFSVWAILATVRTPSVRGDLVTVALVLVSSVARLQFVALLYAALGAVLLLALIERPESGSAWRSAVPALRKHWALVASSVLVGVLGLAAAAGTAADRVAGRGAHLQNVPAPTPWDIVHLFVEHLAELSLAVGVIPFVGALVAGYLWLRGAKRHEVSAFAVVALAITTVTLLTTAYAAYVIYAGTPGDLPRIHERYTIYVVPLFLIALVASATPARSRALLRVGLVATAIVALLPLLIPFGRYVNNSIIADTFNLEPFGEATAGVIAPVSHAALAALILSAALGSVYALARTRLDVVAIVLVLLFAFVSATVQNRLVTAGNAAAPAQTVASNWVDVAAHGQSVAYIEAPHRVGPISPTVFDNVAVDRLYFHCVPNYTADFGEQLVTLDGLGRLHHAGSVVRASDVVVSSGAGLAGTVIARDTGSRLVVIRLEDGVARVKPNALALWACAAHAVGDRTIAHHS
ncbi:MAG TPA: hypothetical protein VH063_01740 [Gaiellaceae bacterium]|nr:hypothetical protein [Gaiellaceae bacterium]